MTVHDLVAKLLMQDQNAEVVLLVSWADDSAISDDGEELDVTPDACAAEGVNTVVIGGWMSNTSGDLRHGLTEEEDV